MDENGLGRYDVERMGRIGGRSIEEETEENAKESSERMTDEMTFMANIRVAGRA